ncbi:MAG: pre-16S rRNA-processing nuclease YqgF [Armatimonadota bacterium]
MTPKTVLSIDPGTSKCGLALVQRESNGTINMLWHDVVPIDSVLVKLHEAYIVHEFHLVILGDSTGSKQVKTAIRRHLPSMGLLVIDEKETTIQARERYWESNPRTGWRKLLPASLQVPPEPYDDFAALVLAERVLSEG